MGKSDNLKEELDLECYDKALWLACCLSLLWNPTL